MKKQVTLMITCSGGTLVPAAIEMLRASERFDYRIVCVNASGGVLAEQAADAFHVVPKGDAPEYLDAVLRVVREENVDVVLPWSDPEAETLAAGAEALREAGAVAIAASPACLDRIADKHKTYEFIAKAGLRAPRFTAVTDVDALLEAVSGYGYPQKTVIVKPSRSRGGRGLQVLLGAEEVPDWLGSGQREQRVAAEDLSPERAKTFFDDGDELLVMPCLGVPAYDADVLALGGDEFAVVVRRRANPTGIPFTGNTVEAEADLTAYCMDVARALKLEALHDIDLMQGEDGRPIVLEVNPRPSGSLPASMAAGFPFIDWAVARALGEAVEFAAPVRTVEVGRSDEETAHGVIVRPVAQDS